MTVFLRMSTCIVQKERKGFLTLLMLFFLDEL